MDGHTLQNSHYIVQLPRRQAGSSRYGGARTIMSMRYCRTSTNFTRGLSRYLLRSPCH